jgi:hypothetical protein
MIKLKNCPFCGREVHWCGEYPGDEAHECHQISCPGCSIQFDVDDKEAKDAETLEGLREVVAETWNRRA